MAAPRFIVGIDLGTTHTVVAYVDTGAARGADAEAGSAAPIRIFDVDQHVARGEMAPRPVLPSVRYHPAEGELAEADMQTPWPADAIASRVPGVLGDLARELGARVPGRLVTSAKSWLSHGAVDRTAPILPWAAPDDVPRVSPVDASASYLGHLRAAWDYHHPREPLAEQDIVLTVPASFDEGARALTLEAARSAGLPRVRLLEEPQAAFYDWLARHRDDLDTTIQGVRLALVCDVGGGTTDLTLIQVELRESGVRLTRIAVGEHLMLGGDNMDLALARRAEARVVAGGAALDAGRLSQLIQQCRAAKELLLSDAPPERANVTVFGGGSRLVGGARSTEITRSEIDEIVLDGFFPPVAAEERPARRRGGIVEFGLPYVADPAVTRHVAAFLAAHAAVAREALGVSGADAAEAPAIADAVLLNGGVFRASPLARRLLDVLGSWRGHPLRLLDNDAPELAVARGAAAYGLARRGVGVRIGGGSARSYYAVLDSTGAERRGVCILPRGAEEGEEIVQKDRTFSLVLGRPVRFHLVTSTADKTHRPGDLVALGDEYAELPPIAAVLEDRSDASATQQPTPRNQQREVLVRLGAALTEVGTLELGCVAADDASARRRWKLEFQLRGSGWSGEGSSANGTGSGSASDSIAPTMVTTLHPRFADATARIHRIYGKSSQQVEPREVKTLRNDLEKVLGDRETWDTPLLRELYGALWAGTKRRRRSSDHERVWIHLSGYCLRPGFGYPLDDWRTKELWSIYPEGVQFVPEEQVWSQWWILWRRVAGGLDASAQERILADLEPYLLPPSPRPRPRPKGPRMLAYDDMVRLAASLERLSPERKTQVGGWLLERLLSHGERPAAWWAIGRLGARVPFYGSAHTVVPADVAAEWLDHVLALDWRRAETAAFAASQLARVSGDRGRDLPDPQRVRVADRLEQAGAPAAWPQMVREHTRLDEADERRVFGESLPPGLRLVH